MIQKNVSDVLAFSPWLVFVNIEANSIVCSGVRIFTVDLS